MDQSTAHRVAGAERPPPGVRRVASEAEAGELAGWLLTPGRRWPVVVLTIPGGHDEPFGDPEQIKDAVGDLAEVVLIPTGDASWAFARVMPLKTQVYGGAGRVYPVEHHWVTDPTRSRLHFAYSSRDRERVTEQLINDALQTALAAGLVESRATPGAQQRSGRVKGLIGSRALVALADRSTATVWEELTLPGVALDRVLTSGQSVTGAYDPASRRLDLRGALRYVDPADARAGVAEVYRAGDVVLAGVTAVTDDAVSLRLLPGLTIDVGRDAVTSNPNDTLAGLFTVGEVVACRLVSTEPPRLRLDDVDDDEEPEPPPSLLPDGPPWLRLPPLGPPAPPAPAAPTAAAAPMIEPAGPAAGVTAVDIAARPALPEPGATPGEAARTASHPTPLDLARRSGAPQPRPAVASPDGPPEPAGPAAPAPPPAAGLPLATQTRLMHLSNELAAERATRKTLAEELADLRDRAAQMEEEGARAKQAIERLQTRYRKADLARQRAVEQLKSAHGRAEAPPGAAAPLFLDPETEFRFEVTLEWARRIPAAEKDGKPLAGYTLGPDFLDSIAQVEGVSRAKVVAVVVEVLTGQVQHIAGRDAHQLRAGGPGSPYVRRDDGSTCWRVALQRETPSARRLHYWRNGDHFELSRVVLHDDFRP